MIGGSAFRTVLVVVAIGTICIATADAMATATHTMRLRNRVQKHHRQHVQHVLQSDADVGASDAEMTVDAADANANADRVDVGWDSGVGSDGEMHWLRHTYRVANVLGAAPVSAFGPRTTPWLRPDATEIYKTVPPGGLTAMPGVGPHEYRINPEHQPPTEHAELLAVNLIRAYVSADDKTWLRTPAVRTAIAAALAAPNAVITAVQQAQAAPPVGNPWWEHCPAELIAALANTADATATNTAVNGGGNAGAKGTAIAAAIPIGVHSANPCSLATAPNAGPGITTLADAKRLARALTLSDAQLDAIAHHLAIIATRGHTGLDFWFHRNWLYGVNRAHGHRIEVVTGFLAQNAGPAAGGNDANVRVVGHNGQPTTWGRAADVALHLRPRAFDGDADPINFIPGSEFVRDVALEEFVVNGGGHAPAMFLTSNAGGGGGAARCPPNSVRMYITLNYGGAPANRRPESIKHTFDLTQQCLTGTTRQVGPLVSAYETTTLNP